MTKYIVNSGNISGSTDHGQAYFSEMVKDLGPNPKILLCYFANPREDWDERFAQAPDRIRNLINPDIKPAFELTMPANFAKQCQEADAICIHGGDDHLLLYWLRQFDLPQIWEGKTIAVSSASSDALSTSFWTCDWRQCMDGLGILPIKFIPHFEGWNEPADPRGPIDWAAAKAELATYGDTSLPIYALREGEFHIFNL